MRLTEEVSGAVHQRGAVRGVADPDDSAHLPLERRPLLYQEQVHHNDLHVAQSAQYTDGYSGNCLHCMFHQIVEFFYFEVFFFNVYFVTIVYYVFMKLL